MKAKLPSLYALALRQPLLSLSIALLLLSACTLIPTTRKEILLPEFRFGTEGLAISFEAFDKVFEGGTFALNARIENRGASDVGNGIWSLNFEKGVLALVAPTQSTGLFNLKGKSVYLPRGDFELLSFKIKALELPPMLGGYSTTVILNVCYKYSTELHTTTCVDTDLEGKLARKTCVPTPQSFSSQGAPIAITSVTPRMLPHEEQGRIVPQFEIEIQNFGKGDVILEGSYSKPCSGTQVSREEYGVVAISAFLEERPLKCGREEATLKEGKAKFVCQLPQGISTERGTYSAPLRIELNYGYYDLASTVINIEKRGKI